MGKADVAASQQDEWVALSAEDRAILALESPTIAGHTCKVIHLTESAPDLAQLRARIAERIHLAPALTRRLETGRDRTPGWVPDPDFAVEQHVVEHHHDHPVDAAGLRRCVATLFEQRLERDRPLWRVDLVTLRDGHRALVWRIHHALADGAASVRYGRTLLWDDPPETHMTTAQTAAQHAVDETRRRAHLPSYLRREFVRAGVPSPFDGEICNRREVAFASIELPPLRQAAKAIDGATSTTPCCAWSRAPCGAGFNSTTASWGRSASRCRSACTVTGTPTPTTIRCSRSGCRWPNPIRSRGCA